MNAKGKELGMKQRPLRRPTGLSSGNVASAADLTKLVIAASQEPLIEEYSTSDSLTVRSAARCSNSATRIR